MPKIILVDADVVSHFVSAGEIVMLPSIFPYPVKLLDKVYTELERWRDRKREVDNLINFKLLEIIPFPDDNPEIVKEFFWIRKMLDKGMGESACMAVARYTKDILASSNLKDIKNYCERHKIMYLTTMDFLCYALSTGLFDESRCNAFIQAVRSKGQKLPVGTMNAYTCRDLSQLSD
ncbi:hypothetical protein [Fibrella arboris]|uniref:hypothetical protein n=1 Tax=Fibrella arboris TaxID=3242486 RepID=UPI003521D793